MAIIKKNKKNRTERKIAKTSGGNRKARENDVVTQTKTTTSIQAGGEELQRMFAIYVSSNGNLAAVSKATGVHRKTVRKYKELFSWDEERKKIAAGVHARVVSDEIDRRHRNIQVLDKGIENIHQQLVPDQSGIVTNVPMKILPALIKSQHELLEGSPDETPPITPELRSALNMIDALGKEVLKGIADHIARIKFQIPDSLSLETP